MDILRARSIPRNGRLNTIDVAGMRFVTHPLRG